MSTQNRGIELAFLLTLPAAIALAVLATPILSVLFERGAFGPTDTAATAAALAAYAAGLPAFVLIKVLAPAFFARHDTATPVKVAVAAMAVNLCLTLILMQFLAHVGIALATTMAGWLNALLLLALLIRRGYFGFDGRARRNLPRVGAAALGMGAVLAVLRLALAPMLVGSYHASSRRTCSAGLRRARHLYRAVARSRDCRLARTLGAVAPATGLTGAAVER